MTDGPPQRARYTIEILPSAARELERVPSSAREPVVRAIDALAGEPRPPGSEQVIGTGDERIMRIRVGAHRVLYQIRDSRLVVLVVRVADRRDAYSRTAMKRLLAAIRAARSG